MGSVQYYAVAVGRKTGIFMSWDECKKHVAGLKNAKYKKFKTRAEADEFVKCLGSSILSQFGVQVSEEVRQAVAIVREDREDDKPSDEALMAFTDGSAFANGRKGARAGYAVVWPNYDDTMTMYEPIAKEFPQTNNRAEYSAAWRAMTQANELDPQGMRTLWIYTDSMLLINSMTKWIKKWKTTQWKTTGGGDVEHQDLLKDMDAMMQRRRVKFVHVTAHTGGADWKAVWNARADELARLAAGGGGGEAR